MAVVMMMSMLMPISAANLNATYQKASYYDIATTAYSRMLLFQDGVVVAANPDKEYGLIDAAGREVVPFQYAGMWSLGNGLFQVENKDGFHGIINAKGKELYPVTASWISVHNNTICVSDANYQTNYFDLNMNPISQEDYWNTDSATTTVAALQGYDYYWENYGYYSVYSGSRMGVLDSNFKVIFALGEYDSIDTIPCGDSVVFSVAKNGEYGLMDSSGNTLCAMGTYSGFDSDWNGRSLIKVYQGQYPDRKMGAIDAKGNILVPLGDYTEIGGLNKNGYVSAVTNPYDWDNITSTVFQNGKIVKTFPGMHVATEVYYRDLAFSKNGQTNGMMNVNGTVTIPDKYQYITYTGHGEDLATVLVDENWNYFYGLYSGDGKQILKDQYTTLSHLADGKYKVCDGTYYGVLSSDGGTVIPMKYVDLRVETLSFLYVYDGAEYSILDLNNNVVVPASKEPINLFDDVMVDNDSMYVLDSTLSKADYLKKSYDGYDGDVMPFRIKTDSGYATIYADYNKGVNHGTIPYAASNINADGQFVYIDSNGLYGFASTTEAVWTGGKPAPVTPPAPAAPETPAETKDEPSVWAAELVNEAVTAGIVPEIFQAGYQTATTRAEFCALAVQVYETVTGTQVEGRVTFNDTDDVNVQKAVALGVASGRGEGKFDPDSPLTREQAAVMLSQLADALGKSLEKTEASFADNDQTSGWAAGFVGGIAKAGIMSGVGDNKFAPQASYTHEQSVITALKLFKLVNG